MGTKAHDRPRHACEASSQQPHERKPLSTAAPQGRSSEGTQHTQAGTARPVPNFPNTWASTCKGRAERGPREKPTRFPFCQGQVPKWITELSERENGEQLPGPGSQDLRHVFSSTYCCCFLPKAFYWEWTFMELATAPPAIQNGFESVRRKTEKGSTP